MLKYIKYSVGILVLGTLYSVLGTVSAYQQQGFTSYSEGYGNKISFHCETQCLVLLEPLETRDYLYIQGTLQGNGVIGYGFLVGQQVVPGEMIQINGMGNIDQQLLFSSNPYISQIPKEAGIVLVVEGNIQADGLMVQGRYMGFFESLSLGFNEALQYKEYNPRTINFLEGPKRNGKYINKQFFWWIVGLLMVALIRYLVSDDKKTKKKVIGIGIAVIVFFWLFFDFFSTVNQVKIYKQTMSATNIMENGRVGRTSDFYQFLDFIRTKVPKGEKGSFIAPYPFHFEGQYHIYPDVRFDVITGVDYLFFYNPYGPQSPFGFIDPIYADGILTRNDLQFDIQEEIALNTHAKIYILKK